MDRDLSMMHHAKHAIINMQPWEFVLPETHTCVRSCDYLDIILHCYTLWLLWAHIWEKFGGQPLGNPQLQSKWAAIAFPATLWQHTGLYRHVIYNAALWNTKHSHSAIPQQAWRKQTYLRQIRVASLSKNWKRSLQVQNTTEPNWLYVWGLLPQNSSKSLDHVCIILLQLLHDWSVTISFSFSWQSVELFFLQMWQDSMNLVLQDSYEAAQCRGLSSPHVDDI